MHRISVYLTVLGLFLVLTVPLEAVTVASPSGNITVTLDVKERLEPYPMGRRLYYSVTYKGKAVLLDSPFGLDFKGMPPFSRDLSIENEKMSTIDNTWEPVWGTHARIRNHATELSVALVEKRPPDRKLHFTVRVFDEGVAFRYSIPAQSGIGEFQLTSERSEFHFPPEEAVWAADYGNFRSHQESAFVQQRIRDMEPGAIIGCPLLVQLDGIWVALTEANLTDWAGLYFTRAGIEGNGFASLLSPRLDQPDVAVIRNAPHCSPWRTILIGEKPGDLIESNIIVNLNEPLAIEDPSWIRPGVSAWDRWWPGSYAPDFEDGKLGMSTESMKYFVDFAAEMGWEYQLVDWTWYGPPFDPNHPFGLVGNPDADITKSIPNLDIPELIAYAAARNVRILLWLDWDNANRQMDKAFPLYEKWGVAGVKVDFMQRDDQEMVNFYHSLVKLAAKHKLTVDFHGSYKPTGLRRTYPNLLTREGVLGNEYNKWSALVTPEHNVTLPFTRMLCGPMDYTPGGFRQKNPGNFRAVGSNEPGPFVMGTRAHQLAMFVIFESPLQVAPDTPYNYRMSPAGLDFLKAVPTSWDNTKVLDGFPGQFIIMARQSGNDWFLGGMNGNSARSVHIPLEFLGPGEYSASICADADEVADYPDRILETTRDVTSTTALRLTMASGGGFVARLSAK